MEHLLISACLIGTDCKYTGGNNKMPDEVIGKLQEKYILVPVCPEVMGGLPCPRDPSELRGDKVVSCQGKDVTYEFEAGARLALEAAINNQCHKALMKERSPSCGRGIIYDGSFTGTKIPGNGKTVQLLIENGTEVYNENEIAELL